ncbi:uncharacterized protein [Temnothorax longispinosus]|uniref:uncharacterized protein n=1 Tax=Temnothorax longispinosus TaxID=300112 RepID=UPI003A996BA7
MCLYESYFYTDPKFAKRVANAALRRTHDTFQTQVVSDNLSEDEERQEEETEGDDESTKEGGAKWNSAATLLLLHEYSEKESLFKSGKRAHRFYWEEIDKIMRSKGYTFSWGQISSKMDSLKRRYKKIKDASKQSGNGRIPNWEFYETMEKIFGQRPWVTPLSTASSSGPSNDTSDSVSSSVLDTASCTSQGDKKKKSRAEELADAIYSKIKSDREEHYLKKLEAKEKLHRQSEERKEIRHKEKMAMRTQFLQLLDARLKVIDAAEKTTMDCDIENTQYLGPSSYN